MKYIDAEKLIAEIKALKRRKGFLPFENTEITEAYMARGIQFACDDIVSLITSLQQDIGEVSDGYHAFNELYYYRMLYNAAFFNLLPKGWVHKSKRHHTGEECFGGGWFIVMANLPTGQISNHYELKDWDLFKVQEKEFADEWDGHTPQEAAKRLYEYLQKEQPIKVYRVENEKEQKGLWRKFDGTWEPLFDMLTDGQCKDMPMEDSPIYREGGKQWFASAPSKETLQKWFSKRDLEELTAKGFTISEFEVVGHKKISDFEYIFTRDSIISRTYLKVSDIYPQEQPDMIQWTGNNLKEVIDFMGKSPRSREWFKSWEEYENYVHTHNDILKLFCEDGSHYEVPVGAWIVKTPDGYNVPSVAKYLQQGQLEVKSYIEKLLKECTGKDGEYYRSRRETLAHLFAYLGGNPLEYMRQPVKRPEVELEKEIEIFTTEKLHLPITKNRYEPMDITEGDWIDCICHFYEFGQYNQYRKDRGEFAKIGEIARHLITVKQNVEDMRLSEDEWSLLERIGYPENINARKEE